MATMRSYDDGCAAAHALDLVGERWALLVVRELLLGPKRFTDLRAGLPGASPNVLAQRLRELEGAGVVVRRKLPPPAASRVYELRLGEDRFRAEVADGRFEVERGSAEDPDAIIESDPGTLATLVYEGRPLEEALRRGEIRIEGERSAVERFLTLFPMPEPASAAAGV